MDNGNYFNFDTIEAVWEAISVQLEQGLPTSLGGLTAGGMLFYGGLAGIMISIIAILLCFVTFPIKRRRLLKKLGGSKEE